MNLLKKIYLTIDGYDLIRPGETLLVAVSGGPDSVCLLHTLREINEIQQLDWNMHIAHYNHGLRGSASDEDEEFVRGMAEKLGVPFHQAKGDVRRKKERERLSLEEASRNARHDFLSRTARRAKA